LMYFLYKYEYRTFKPVVWIMVTVHLPCAQVLVSVFYWH
jgi:hypothetical protein